ncbi:MAG: polyprenyl synthetase family protein [Defluviitaleaceae bacterium]|nr:polyprenyl synthetase family protein [Defluviitaleaceae bacterium]
MELNIVKESGFCHGVRAAVHKANQQGGSRVYLYGDLVNNRHVMARYIRDGFIVANSTDEIAPNSVVIIRAHGVGRAVYDALAEKNAEIIDCTCVKVKAIHKIVARTRHPNATNSPESGGGTQTVVIIGKKNHPEVLGISGWCENFVVIENISELDAPLPDGELCVVAQTTCNKNFWQSAVEIIRTNRPDAEIFDTLCDVTAKRMENAAKLAEESDCMIIVGDTKSANSVELFNACARQTHYERRGHMPPATHSPEAGQASASDKKIFFVSSPEEIADHAAEIIACEKVGIAGSASAPAETIAAIHDFLLFAKFLADAKSEIEAASDEYFTALLADATADPFVQSALRDLHNQNKNGKRIRGAMIMLGYSVTNENCATPPRTPQGDAIPRPPTGETRDARFSIKGVEGSVAPLVGVQGQSPRKPELIAATVAYEIFQTAILIHDDIIDKSETRRGKRTIHASESDAHFGTSRAICIGDYGLFLANKILAEAGFAPEILAKLFRLFAEIQIKTIQGEIMDVSLPVLPVDILKQYDEYMRIVGAIYDSKTAWYTLAGPLMLGAVCGGASDEAINVLREIALPLGMAFQIKDDLLGVFASEEVLGKPPLADVAEKKQTILYGFALKHASPEQRDRLEKIYGNPLADEAGLLTVREIFTQTGAKKFAEDEISRLSQIALDNAAGLRDSDKPLVRGLVHYLTTRRY